jgi:acetyltransferase-like isoleucine patch superfamily enzyme
MRFIDESAVIGEGVRLGYGVVIEKDVVIGARCEIDHHAVIYEGTQIGANCRIGASAVMGKKPQAAPTSVNTSPSNLPPLVLGDNSIIGAHAVLYRGSVIGQSCLIADLSFIRENTFVGDFVIVGTHVTIENRVKIGAYTKIQTGAYITAAIEIEENVFIAPCVVTTNDNFMGRTEERFKHWGGATIRRGARIGAGVTLLPNVEIGEESFVAAASVVTRNVPPRTQVMGIPARFKKDVPEVEFLTQKKAEA